MKPKQKYQIIGGISLGHLEDKVNEAIRAGWTPTGGVSVGMAEVEEDGETEIRSVFLQAVVRKLDENEDRENPFFDE